VSEDSKYFMTELLKSLKNEALNVLLVDFKIVKNDQIPTMNRNVKIAQLSEHLLKNGSKIFLNSLLKIHQMNSLHSTSLGHITQ
jgi:hypothetical protein